MEDSLVSRRSKRSTAGNRMEAALAEFKAEEVGVDVEEDVDFIMDKEEEDAFESDFESTDEEAVQEDVDTAAEKVARDDERRPRKTGQTQLDRVTAAAHKRHQAVFNTDLQGADVQRKKAHAAEKLKRKVALGAVVNAETGEIIPMDVDSTAKPDNVANSRQSRRRSTRTYTVESRAALNERIRKEEQDKKASAPKKVKTKAPPPTQEELLRRALEMEEGNIEEHRNYLATEEEKRKRARAIRTEVTGPLIRWVSKKEQVKVVVQVPAPAKPPPPPAHTPIRPAISSGQPSTMTYQYGYAYPNMPGTSTPTTPTTPNAYPGNSYYPYAVLHPSQAASSSNSAIPPGSPQPTFVYHNYQPSQPLHVAPQSPNPPSQPQERIETVSKSYVVVELGQDEEPRSKPSWNDLMNSMFGDHVKWDELRVYTGRTRPMSRITHTCPITGLPAPYLDPRSGVPFANAYAYQILSRILKHEFIWDETLGRYTAAADIQAAAEEEAQHILQQEEQGHLEQARPPAASTSVSTRTRGAKQSGTVAATT